MTDLSFAVQLRKALDTMGKPARLASLVQFIAENDDIELPGDPLSSVCKHLHGAGPNDGVLRDLTLAIQRWDHMQEGEWSAGTAPDSPERRDLVLSKLGFDTPQGETVNGVVRRLDPQDLAVVIAEEHEPWYEKRRAELPSFYWRHYAEQLLRAGNWLPEAVSKLDLSTTDVIARISDPSRPEIRATRGLVMGYVQSGKTAHFTGLIAKAADAGYRLVIVLAGTLDILRKQTQRRLDKDIIGRELLPSGEYASDSEWPAFVEHGGRPVDLGAFDWERLTDRQDDYTSLKRHLSSLLGFTPADRTRRFNDPANLRGATARLAVIKKNPLRLSQICDDLERLEGLRTALAHVPTLVVDDESDQASVNTVDRSRPGKEEERTRTNAAIGRLLRLLPRAQYVGYTATPYANVFIDPEDEEDLFPRDFIISLQRPNGYMGVSDFHDLTESFESGDFRGKQNAFVRSVLGDNADEGNLPKAIDSFVLAGALKLFRENREPGRWGFRHHTMLVHHSAQQLAHAEDKEAVAAIFAAGRRYDRVGLQRLKTLYETDYSPVSRVQAPDLPMPGRFDELIPFISECISRVSTGDPVRVVNGDPNYRDDTPDFDQEPVWAILVGGTKLSRGYTVEGLTVSYYRRPTGAGDTLLQMGRWFGFRNGYRDLVRLYIGRAEKRGKTVIDLYDAFRAMCDDEEALRRDLEKYEREGLRPRQVPPLVQQYLDVLPPTARNKMFNAVIAAKDFTGETTEKTTAPEDTTRSGQNLALVSELLRKSDLGAAEAWKVGEAEGKSATVRAFVGSAKGEDVVRFMDHYQWAAPNHAFELERKFVRERLEAGAYRDWFVLIPQLKGAGEVAELPSGLPRVRTVQRTRVDQGRFKAYRDPQDARLADYLAGDATLELDGPKPPGRPGRPVLALYFVKNKGNADAPLAVGFFVRYPGVPKKSAITWTVRDRRNERAVVVEKGEDAV